MPKDRTIRQWEAVELTFHTCEVYDNPYTDVDLNGMFTGPGGERLTLPGFYDGERNWKIRFAPTAPGRWVWRTRCSNTQDTGLHANHGVIDSVPWTIQALAHHPHRRGFIRVHDSGRFFTYPDGTPFFWLGDTLWFGFATRCDVEKVLPHYLADRKEKGFTLIQILAGSPARNASQPTPDELEDNWLNPEDYMNEAGASYDRSHGTINAGYFSHLDRRINLILAYGFVPCIFAMWGNEMPFLGVVATRRLWRYLVARYTAYNVMWGLAGEYDLVPHEDSWREIGEYIDQIDPYGHPTTVHPTAPHSSGRHFQADAWYDFSMIQVGHSLAHRKIVEYLPYIDYHRQPIKPSIMAEAWYEGFPCQGADRHPFTDRDVRFASYVPLLQGCAGITYGAHGTWVVYDGSGKWPEADRPNLWIEDLALPGSAQMRHLRMLMESVRWWALEPHPEMILSPQDTPTYCAAIPGEAHVAYIAGGGHEVTLVLQSEKSTAYQSRWFDPRTGDWLPADPAYERIPFFAGILFARLTPPDDRDWALVMRKEAAAADLSPSQIPLRSTQDNPAA